MLNLKGYRILSRRYRCPAGEIDLIAQRYRTVAFVEVKVRPTIDEGLASVTWRQQDRIARAAEYWLAGNQGIRAGEFRFDVIALAPWAFPRHLEGAFDSGQR